MSNLLLFVVLWIVGFWLLRLIGYPPSACQAARTDH